MNIGLLGFGVVGGGVWELAQENRALNVKKVLDIQSSRGMRQR